VEYRIRTKSAAETIRFGEQFARCLRRGHVVGLMGDLGAGKTCMIQGVCRGLGVHEPVTSPSFVIINVYRGADAPVYHFDLYRIAEPDELLELGCEEYFYGDGICLVEWAERAGALLPEEAIIVELRWAGDEERDLVVRGLEEDAVTR